MYNPLNFLNSKQRSVKIPDYIPSDLQELYILANRTWQRNFPERAKKVPISQQQFESLIWMRQVTDSPSLKTKAGRILDQQILLKAKHGDVNFQLDWAKRNMAGQVIGQIGKPDYLEAKKWFEIASAKGNAEAFYWLGCMYAKGNKSISKDLEKAITYYQQAKELGYTGAISELEWIQSRL